METDAKSSKTRLPQASELQDAIRRRAEEIYARNGRVPGHDLENWAQAEREISGEKDTRSSRRKAVVIKVDGVQYVGEYALESSDDYTPGEFTSDIPVRVRFDGEKMFLKRANGKELETRIVRKIG